MKLICAVPSISMVSIIICRHYSLSSSGLLMFKFRRFLMLVLHRMFLSRLNYITFSFSVFLFKLVVKDGLYYVYQLKASRSGKIINRFYFVDHVH